MTILKYMTKSLENCMKKLKEKFEKSRKVLFFSLMRSKMVREILRWYDWVPLKNNNTRYRIFNQNRL